MNCPQCQQAAPAEADFCPGCGTRLRLACPACGVANAATYRFCLRCGAALTAPSAEPAPTAPEPAGRPGKALVLVADDDPLVRDLVSDVLAEAGFRTVRASDGAEVMDLALQQKPALILLDVIMPRMDGYTTLTRLRGHRATQHIPVVILTGQPGPLYETISFGAGATAHMTKPFSPRQLMDTVERVLAGIKP